MATDFFSEQGRIELQEDIHEICLHSAETHELDISQEDVQKCLDYESKLQELYLKKPKLGKDAHLKDYIELWASPQYKEWDKAYHDLQDEYEAFFARITGREPQIMELPNLFAKSFAVMLNGALTNDLLKAATVKKNGEAVIRLGVGNKITAPKIEYFKVLTSPAALKILFAAIEYLTHNNPPMARKSLRTTVEIPLSAYANACGVDIKPRTMKTPEEQTKENEQAYARKKVFIRTIKENINCWTYIHWTGSERNLSYKEMSIFTTPHSVNVNADTITITFDSEAAKYFIRAYAMQLGTNVFKINNKNANAFFFAYKFWLQNSIDHNDRKGTANTLKVKTLLKCAPEIGTYEEIQARGQRNWKDKIKAKFENAMEECVRVGVLSQWEYRDSKTDKKYKPSKLPACTYEQWSNLVVDFTIPDAPPKEERDKRQARIGDKIERLKKEKEEKEKGK